MYNDSLELHNQSHEPEWNEFGFNINAEKFMRFRDASWRLGIPSAERRGSTEPGNIYNPGTKTTSNVSGNNVTIRLGEEGDFFLNQPRWAAPKQKILPPVKRIQLDRMEPRLPQENGVRTPVSVPVQNVPEPNYRFRGGFVDPRVAAAARQDVADLELLTQDQLKYRDKAEGVKAYFNGGPTNSTPDTMRLRKYSNGGLVNTPKPFDNSMKGQGGAGAGAAVAGAAVNMLPPGVDGTNNFQMTKAASALLAVNPIVGGIGMAAGLTYDLVAGGIQRRKEKQAIIDNGAVLQDQREANSVYAQEGGYNQDVIQFKRGGNTMRAYAQGGNNIIPNNSMQRAGEQFQRAGVMPTVIGGQGGPTEDNQRMMTPNGPIAVSSGEGAEHDDVLNKVAKSMGIGFAEYQRSLWPDAEGGNVRQYARGGPSEQGPPPSPGNPLGQIGAIQPMPFPTRELWRGDLTGNLMPSGGMTRTIEPMPAQRITRTLEQRPQAMRRTIAPTPHAIQMYQDSLVMHDYVRAANAAYRFANSDSSFDGQSAERYLGKARMSEDYKAAEQRLRMANDKWPALTNSVPSIPTGDGHLFQYENFPKPTYPGQLRRYSRGGPGGPGGPVNPLLREQSPFAPTAIPLPGEVSGVTPSAYDLLNPQAPASQGSLYREQSPMAPTWQEEVPIDLNATAPPLPNKSASAYMELMRQDPTPLVPASVGNPASPNGKAAKDAAKSVTQSVKDKLNDETKTNTDMNQEELWLNRLNRTSRNINLAGSAGSFVYNLLSKRTPGMAPRKLEHKPLDLDTNALKNMLANETKSNMKTAQYSFRGRQNLGAELGIIAAGANQKMTNAMQVEQVQNTERQYNNANENRVRQYNNDAFNQFAQNEVAANNQFRAMKGQMLTNNLSAMGQSYGSYVDGQIQLSQMGKQARLWDSYEAFRSGESNDVMSDDNYVYDIRGYRKQRRNERKAANA
jgi:hypothetical protein